MTETALFSNIPKQDYLTLFRQASGEPDYHKVVQLLDLKKKDVAKAVNISVASVRYDAKVPAELSERMREWAIAMNLVAQFFKDQAKTILWFKTPNPLLGDVAPRDMIRVGRFRKLNNFILNALRESDRPHA